MMKALKHQKKIRSFLLAFCVDRYKYGYLLINEALI